MLVKMMEEGELSREDLSISNILHKIEQNEKLDMENEKECSDNSEDNEIEEEFMYLLRINELDEALELIKSKKIKNLNYRNEDGNTALHYVMANNLEVSTYFLLKVLKVNYNVCNNNGNSPLVWAVQNKAIDSIRVLLLHDYEININFIKNNIKERNKYFKKDEIESYINYNPKCLLNGIKGLEIDRFKLTEDIIEYYNINDNFNPENKINILNKNNFGKSLLSEVFNSNNLELLQMILEHPISSSLDSYKSSNDNIEVNKRENEEFIIHNFNFNTFNAINDNNLVINDEVVKIREISISNDEILNSKESELDTSGLMIWESSIICSYWLFDLLNSSNIYKIDFDKIINDNFNKQLPLNHIIEDEFDNVIELGSGCGLVAISFYKFCKLFKKKLKKVIVSDLSNDTINNLSYNLNINIDEDDGIEVMKLNWKDVNIKEKFKIIIGSDLIYDSSLIKPLIDTINVLLDENGIFLYCFKSERNGSNEFIDELIINNYLVELRQVPIEYQQNPLIGKSKEYCLSFFPDLESDDYFLLKAIKLPDV